MARSHAPLAPPSSSDPRRDHDPLIAAADLLHRAGRLPFDAHEAGAWARRYRALVQSASEGVNVHRWLTTLPDSALERVAAEQPQLRNATDRQLVEHADITSRLAELMADAISETPLDTAAVVELMEGALALERELRRHHEHLVDLVYEAANREWGGPG